MFENKSKLLVVAIGAAFALPLAAQAQSNVKVYGKLYPQIVNTNLSGATATGTGMSTLSAPAAGTDDRHATSMDSPNSRLGFSGTENLGNNMKAIFQLEMGFGVDTGALASATSLFSQNTFVGLAGDFGTVKLGNMDTVYKTLGDSLSFLGIASGNFIAISNILSKTGFGTSSSSSFHLRRTNSMIYESPSFGGFQGLFDYSLGEVAGSFSSGSVISTGVKYVVGPVYVTVAYERHKDLFGGSNNVPTALKNNSNKAAHSKDSAARVQAQYKFSPNTRAEANFSTLKYEETGGTVGKFENYKHNSWAIGAEHKVGALTLVATYGQAEAGSCSLVGGIACNTDGLDGRMLNLGAGYSLSKRTMLYALGSLMNNSHSSVYSNYLNGKPTPGQDIRTLAVGISHSF